MGCGMCRPGETGLGFADIASELSLALSLAHYDPGVDAFPFQSGALFSCGTLLPIVYVFPVFLSCFERAPSSAQ
jgi:hypothetical protein